MQTFQKLIARSDPEVHRHLDRQTMRAERQREDPDHYPAEVQALARDRSTEKPEEEEEEDDDE